MPKPRTKLNKKLPLRWRYKHGAYYYRVPPDQEVYWNGKKEFRLGKTEIEAYATYTSRITNLEFTVSTVNDLLIRYAAEVMPLKSPKTQQSNHYSINRLRPVFGHMTPSHVKVSHLIQYFEILKKKSHATARHDFQLFRHLYTMAVQWGVMDQNPFFGIRLPQVKKRQRYVTDNELAESLKAASPILTGYILLKLSTGLRRGDILRLTLEQANQQVLTVTPHKTALTSGKSLAFNITPQLRNILNYCAMHTKSKKYLFSTVKGHPYIDENGNCNAFDSLWQRYMKRALKQTGLTEKYQEKDLRAKTATDLGLLAGSRLLGHSNLNVTNNHYIRKPEVLNPHQVKMPGKVNKQINQ